MELEIVMPFYGDPRQFRDAVASVLAQSDPNWRLTVIDDCYPDEAPGRWVRSLDDPRIRYFRNERNLGVSGNFQRGVELVEAELMTIMGCDDLMLPDYVARARSAMAASPDASYYQPGVRVIDADGKPVSPLADRVKRFYRIEVDDITGVGGERLVTSLLRGNWTYFPSICWRSSEVVPRGFSSHEVVLDLVLQLEILFDGGIVVLDPVVTFAYRRHAGSVSSWRAGDGSRFGEEREVMSAYAARAAERGWRRAARVGRLRVSSRLNALTRLPSAAIARDGAGLRSLARHAFGS